MADSFGHADSFAAARQQACDKLGFMRSVVIKTENHEWEIPNPSLLSNEQRKAVAKLDLWVQTTDDLDRFNDVTDSNKNKIKGAPKIPWRTKAGEFVEDDYDTRLVKALWGADKFAEFIEDGGFPHDIELIWTQMQRHMSDRKAADSKSGSGDQSLAALSGSD